MRLKDWLQKEGVTQSAFGRRIRRDQQSVSRYASGQRIPDRKTMKRILVATGGEVTPNDFYVEASARGAAA